MSLGILFVWISRFTQLLGNNIQDLFLNFSLFTETCFMFHMWFVIYQGPMAAVKNEISVVLR